MSIRLIAKDLYKLQREVEELQKRLEGLRGPEKEELLLRLQGIRAERDRLKKILEGHKAPPQYRVPK